MRLSPGGSFPTLNDNESIFLMARSYHAKSRIAHGRRAFDMDRREPRDGGGWGCGLALPDRFFPLTLRVVRDPSFVDGSAIAESCGDEDDDSEEEEDGGGFEASATVLFLHDGRTIDGGSNHTAAGFKTSLM